MFFLERCAVWIRGDVDRSHVVGSDEILRHDVSRDLLFGFGVVGRSDSSGTGSDDIGRQCVGHAKGKRGHQTQSWGRERFVMVCTTGGIGGHVTEMGEMVPTGIGWSGPSAVIESVSASKPRS